MLAKPDLKDGEPWSDADDTVLRASVMAGIDLLETAAALGRSGDPFTVYKRAKALGLRWPGEREVPKPK